jgi:hypothetical protein
MRTWNYTEKKRPRAPAAASLLPQSDAAAKQTDVPNLPVPP